MTFIEGPVTTSSSSFSFEKTSASPDFATVTITPAIGVGATYGIIFECPEELTITVIQVVVNSTNYATQSIHTEYTWEDIVQVSPTIQNAITLNATPPTSSYISNTGIRSAGGFPYDGASVTLKTRKVIPDNFDFDPAIHKFKILSSDVLYENNIPDISALLAASSVVIPINNPSVPVFTAKEVGTIQGGTFAIPDANQYLYLIWDFRVVHSSELCYSAISALDACCECEFTCGRCYFSKQQGSIASACVTNTDNFGSSVWSFSSSGATPVVGDSVFDNALGTCEAIPGAPYLIPGYYIVGEYQPSTDVPLKWVRIAALGLVVEAGTCP